MNWLTDFIVPIIKTIVWGVVVFLLGRLLVNKLESGINRTLDRLRKAGPAEFEVSLPKPQSESEAKLSPTYAPLEPVAAESLLGIFEKNVHDAISKIAPAEREASLVRIAAQRQLAWVFETLNFTILGSQIALLLVLNSKPITLTEVRTFHDQAAARFPEYYRSYPFESWLNWFVEVAKFGVRSNDHLAITEAGREFAKYIIARGYILARFG